MSDLGERQRQRIAVAGRRLHYPLASPSSMALSMSTPWMIFLFAVLGALALACAAAWFMRSATRIELF